MAMTESRAARSAIRRDSGDLRVVALGPIREATANSVEKLGLDATLP